MQESIATNGRRVSLGILLIRLMVGAVFVAEGIQKFIYPAARGAGRFERMGFPMPEVMGPFVGAAETVAGAMLLLGLFTRWSAVPILVIMSVAIVTTKVPILLGHGFWGFKVRELSQYGFLSMAHEMRTDWSMWLGSLFLILLGGGRYALDAMLFKPKAKAQAD